MIGVATGLLSGLMGVGGGIIAVPAMVAFLGVTQHKAHGTSLAMMILTATTSAIIYTTRGQVNWGLALLLAIGTVSGAYFGARLMNRVPARRLRQVFGLFLLLVGLKMALSVGGPSAGSAAQPLLSLATIVPGLLIGLVAGVLSGLLGIGGGVVMVPAMVYFMGIDQHTAQGVSLAVIVPTAITGGYAHYKRGNVLVQLALVLGLAAVVGAFAGAWVSGMLPAEALQRGFGVFVIAVAIRMVVVEIRASRQPRPAEAVASAAKEA